jgi:hypothetical protein
MVTVDTGAGGGGGGAATVTADVPLLPSLVAVIVAEPGATPVTRPVDDTVAIDPLDVDHVTVRPVTTFPFASRRVAWSCTVFPTSTVAEEGDRVTVATGGGVTVTDDVPLFPSLVAVMVADPAATAVTKPLEDTVAMDALDVDQVILRPVRTLPPPSRRVAWSCAVLPTSTVAVVGDTMTVATGSGGGGGGAVTVTDAVPVFPSLLAVIVAEPAETPVTRPLEATVAIDAFELDHVTVRSDSTVPLASRNVA